ncbi:MAG: preprotein translocase subunit SecE [Oscillospiraceae bacterium]|nr:preprotein translocase subunit SecE [Oscillospiraceae bacterium]
MAKDPKNRKSFFKNFKAELKKVIWPTPKQIVNGTIAVITIVLIIAGIVFVLDFTFDFFNSAGVNRIKQAIEDRDREDTIDIDDYEDSETNGEIPEDNIIEVDPNDGDGEYTITI